MDLREAWRIARPVEALGLEPFGPLPSVDRESQREAILTLSAGNAIEASLAAWLELRPVRALAAEMSVAAMIANPITGDDSRERARELMVALERRVTESLVDCSEGETLTMLPNYSDVKARDHDAWGKTASVLSEPRSINTELGEVASSPRPPAEVSCPPPWNEPQLGEWLYHRSSFLLTQRNFREILRDAYLIDSQPAKVEFQAIDAMRDAYRNFTEEARSCADELGIESYESMERVEEEIVGKRFPNVLHSDWTQWRREWRVSVGRDSGWMLVPVMCAIERSGKHMKYPDHWHPRFHPGAPAHFAPWAFIHWLQLHTWKVETERDVDSPNVERTDVLLDRYTFAKDRLLATVAAIGDVRINTGKTTIRQFVDWAAEATTLYHSSMLDLALQTARTPGIGVAVFLGELLAKQRWKSLKSHDWDLERVQSELAQTEGSYAEIVERFE